MDEFMFDKRVVRRNIERGLITQQDYINHLERLQDTSSKCEPVEETLYSDGEVEGTADSGSSGETTPQLR
jgi:hypothetical protein